MDGLRPGGELRPCPPSRFEALAVHLQGHDDAGCVRTLRSVTGVLNKVAVKPRPNAGDIKAHIMSALTRSWFKPEHVDVTASNGKVMLTGKANNRSERAIAATTASAAPGVSAVVNDIRVSQARAHLCLKCEKPRPKDRGS